MLKGIPKFLFLFLLIAFANLFILPSKTHAISPNSIYVNVVPENPAPGENTSITLSSYASNLDSVLISWSVNGKKILSGVGKKTFSLSAPASGGEANVTATIMLPDGSIEKTIIIRPAVMALLWQANDSYVPPFYKGKALPTADSQIKIVALPEIKSGSQMVSPKNMTYAWKKDYTNNPDGSGYGKNFFIYTSDYLDDSNNISVTASTLDQKYSSKASVDMPTFQPKIVFYKNDANLGTLWEKALENGYRINGDEIIEAAPYFISPKDIRIPFLVWNWSINGNPVEMLDVRKNLIPLRAQAGVSGTSRIKLEINNIYKIFENASKEINVEF
ncbi:MAG: hypothetical protein UU13_C0004G0003 [Candidatus Nomurabacteria bacterium GW2011_GWB1_40_7]|uniref:Uncharacterized protein n=1 Tax=Candidatus Nomurabacteria bacterium GW2011_GWB1_40_7 TaxID=1618744 RepID=A0A0G0W5F6_9BACT|nr:MAG: hypothetical protein UU13_C0004G0003 [Candidatus Nomurabacteria bacterium GW2011_GWB1_40_7]